MSLNPLSPWTLGAGSCVLGVISHLGIFVRGEWHMQAPAIFYVYSLMTLSVLYLLKHLGVDTVSNITTTALIICTYAFGLFTSIVIYRKYFHRLRHFPGPWAAGATKLWHVWKCRTGKNYLVLEDLHKQYGPVIRTGPEEITMIDPAVPAAVDGPGNECTKPVWYDYLLPEIAINTTRSKKDHDARRRIWDQGFSTQALKAYEARVAEYAETLAARIADLANEGKPVNVSDWFYWFTFDMMGEFAFGRSFGMLRDEEWHPAVKLLRRALSLLGPLSPVPWLGQIGFCVTPWMSSVRDWASLMKWGKQRMAERIQMKVDTPDVSHWLINASIKRGSLEADREWLNGDAFAIIIAGSDTVASTLAFAFHELARDQSRQKMLWDELQNVDIHNRLELQRCEYLTAVINETLRLHPAVPTGGYRQTPPEGITIAGTYIPGGVTIVAPRYSISRLESSYKSAASWIPERWTSRPDMIVDSRGFVPFSLGRYNCVGKSLAMSETRYVIALLIKRFCVEFADKDRGQGLFSDMRDQFTAAPGRLDLKFLHRAHDN